MTSGKLPVFPVLMLAAVLGGCGTNLPDEAGLYVLSPDNEYQRLDGDPAWELKTWSEREDLGGDPRFLVVDPNLPTNSGQAFRMIALRRVGWVRSDIRDGGNIGPALQPRWIEPEIAEFDVPLDYRYGEGRADVIHATPRDGTLEPGLYSLRLDGGTNAAKARFGVAWAAVDKQAYAAAQCVDRYLRPGGPASFRPCSQQHVAGDTGGLRIYLSETARRRVNGNEVLVVAGSVVNPSDETRPIPTLTGELRDSSGRLVHRWTYATPATELGPRRSTYFRVVLDKVPDGATDVSLNFMPAVQAGVVQ